MNDQVQVGVFTNMSNQEQEQQPEVEDYKLPPTAEELVRGISDSPMHEFVARLCHEVNRSYSAAIGESKILPMWEDLELEFKYSALRGVGYVATNDDATGRDMHDAWLVDKRNAGWRYGDVKSVDNKTHPNMVPYDQLHTTQQAKDAIFLTICRAFFE